MALRIFPLLGLVLAASGCRFDSSLPSSASGITCRSDADCPGGRVCRLDLQLCVVSRDDVVAPSVVKGALSQKFLKLGAAMTVSFDVSEKLIRAPSLFLSTGRRLRPLPLDGPFDAQATSFTAQVTAEFDDGEGLATVLVSMEDLGSNAVTNVTVGAVQLDFSAPTVPTDAVAIRPGVVRSQDQVLVQFTASEPVVGDSVKLVATGTTSHHVTDTAAQLAGGASLGFAVDAAPFSGDTSVTLTVVGLQDLAGNVAPNVELGTFAVDDAAPVISPIVVATPVVSRVAGHNQVAFSFTAEPSARLTTTVRDQSARCTVVGTSHQCTVAPRTAEPEGVAGILVQAQDAAGNLAEARASVIYDFTPPAVVDASTSLQLLPALGNPLAHPTSAGPGTTVRVTFMLSEPTTTPALQADELAFANSLNTGSLWVFDAVVPASVAKQGPTTLTVVAEDSVGNRASVPLGLPAPGLVVDTVKPASPASTSALLFRRFPFGADETHGLRSSHLRGGDGAAPEAGTLRVFVGPGAQGELLRIATNADGGFDEAEVSTADVVQPYVDFVDGAGNVSPAIMVRYHEWVAAPANAPSATLLSETWEGAFYRATYPRLDSELIATDGVTAQVEGAGRWFGVEDREKASVGTCSALGSWSQEGQLVAVNPNGNVTSVSLWDGERWLRAPVSDPEGDGSPPATAPLVDGFERGLWAFTDTRVGYQWSGRSWVQRGDQVSPQNRPPADSVVVFDGAPDSRSLVSFGGTRPGGTAFEVWKFDGGAWSRVTESGPWPTLAPAQAATIVGVGAYVLVRQTLSTQLWKWAGSGFSLITSNPVAPGLLLADPKSGTPFVIADNGDVLVLVGTAWVKQSSVPAAPGCGIVANPTTGTIQLVGNDLMFEWSMANGWVTLDSPYDDLALREKGVNRNNPVVFSNPQTGQFELFGGTASAKVTDAATFDGFRWSPLTGLPFTVGTSVASLAPSGDAQSAMLLIGTSAMYQWSSATGWQTVAGPLLASQSTSVVTWSPGDAKHLLVTSGLSSFGEFLFNGTTWVPTANTFGPALGGANPVPPAAMAPTRDGVVAVNAAGTWVRRSTGWAVSTADPEGDGEPVPPVCLVRDRVADVTYAFAQAAFRFVPATASWAVMPVAPVSSPAEWWSSGTTCFAALDSPTGRVFASSTAGARLLAYDPGRSAKPAVTVRLPLTDIQPAPTATVVSAQVTSVLGGQGYNGSTLQPGADIVVWADGKWELARHTNVDASKLERLVFNGVAPLSRYGLMPGGTVRLAFMPTYPNGYGTAKVSVDSVEVRLTLTQY